MTGEITVGVITPKHDNIGADLCKKTLSLLSAEALEISDYRVKANDWGYATEAMTVKSGQVEVSIQIRTKLN